MKTHPAPNTICNLMMKEILFIGFMEETKETSINIHAIEPSKPSEILNSELPLSVQFISDHFTQQSSDYE